VRKLVGADSVGCTLLSTRSALATAARRRQRGSAMAPTRECRPRWHRQARNDDDRRAGTVAPPPLAPLRRRDAARTQSAMQRACGCVAWLPC